MCYLVGHSPTFTFWRKVDLYHHIYSECGLLSHTCMWAIIMYSPHALSDGYKPWYRLDTRPFTNTRRSGYAQLYPLLRHLVHTCTYLPVNCLNWSENVWCPAIIQIAVQHTHTQPFNIEGVIFKSSISYWVNQSPSLRWWSKIWVEITIHSTHAHTYTHLHIWTGFMSIHTYWFLDVTYTTSLFCSLMWIN